MDYNESCAYTYIISKGKDQVKIRIPVIGDTKVEANEQFKLKLSNIQGTLYLDSNLVATGTIIDNDSLKFDAYNKKIGTTNKITTQIAGRVFDLNISIIYGSTRYMMSMKLEQSLSI